MSSPLSLMFSYPFISFRLVQQMQTKFAQLKIRFYNLINRKKHIRGNRFLFCWCALLLFCLNKVLTNLTEQFLQFDLINAAINLYLFEWHLKRLILWLGMKLTYFLSLKMDLRSFFLFHIFTFSIIFISHYSSHKSKTRHHK